MSQGTEISESNIDYDTQSWFEYDCYAEDENGLSTSRKRKRDAMLTVPVSPKFHTSARAAQRAQHEQEEMEWRRLQEEQQQMRERERAEIRKMKALMGEPIIPTRSTQPLTVPEEFHFATAQRVRQQDEPEHEPQPKRRKITIPEGGITVPEPFQFLSEERIRARDAARNSYASQQQTQEWESLAALVKRIENATPDRFKRVPAKKSPPKPLELTRPIPMVLNTELRSQMRPQPPPAPQENTENHVFKARPLDRKILESGGDIGVRRVPKRELTVPESPFLHVKERAALRPNHALEEKLQQEEEIRRLREFKAQPIQYHNSHPTTATHVEHRPLTIPESPMLHTKERAFMRPEPAKPEPPSTQFVARPMPIFHSPVRPVREIKLTEPEPFDLETEKRRIESEFKKQQQIEQERKQLEEARKFKARPMRIASPFRPVLELKITEPEPFQLESEEKHYLAQQKLMQQIAEEEEKRKKAMEFKARPFKEPKPFVPKKSNKPLTEIDEFALNSDVRSQKRRLFDEMMHEKELLAQEAERKRQILEEERRKREIKILRQKLVHKAKPVPQTLYKPEQLVKPAVAPLTEPKTPELHVAKRRKLAGRDL